jgi:hypothetical protein
LTQIKAKAAPDGRGGLGRLARGSRRQTAMP